MVAWCSGYHVSFTLAESEKVAGSSPAAIIFAPVRSLLFIHAFTHTRARKIIFNFFYQNSISMQQRFT